jgi:hypothetical protein
VRNFSASLGLAILGTILVDELRSKITSSLTAQGVPPDKAASEAAHISQTQGSHVGTIPHFVRVDFAHATQTVFFVMAGVMAVAAIVARIGLQRGVQQELRATEDYTSPDADREPGLATEP